VRLAAFAVAAQVVFVAGWVLGGLLESGYSPLRNYVSELGRHGAANPWIFDVSTVVWGAGFVALGLAAMPAMHERRVAWALPLLFVFAGVCALLLAPLRLDCATTISHACSHRRSIGALSWRHYGHEWAAFGIEVSLVLTPLALAVAAWPSRLARLVLGAAILVALTRTASWLLYDELHGYHGLEQRIWLFVVHGWVLICAGLLVLNARGSPMSAAPQPA
jgi:Protein of unknown function (DUF998)